MAELKLLKLDLILSFLMHVLLLAQVGMLLVNVCIYDMCCSKSLLRWTILQSDEDRLTLTKFYETVSIIYLIVLVINDIHGNG